MKRVFFGAFLLMLLTPTVALAAGNPWAPFWGPILSCTGNYSVNGYQPVPESTVPGAVLTHCTSLCDLLKTGQNTINFMLTIALYIAAPLMAAAGGAFMLISGGSSEKVSAGRQMLTGTGIGILIVLLAYPALDTFFVVIGATSGVAHVSWPNIVCDAGLPTITQCTGPSDPCPGGAGQACMQDPSSGGWSCQQACGVLYGACPNPTTESCALNTAPGGAAHQCVKNCGSGGAYCAPGTGNCLSNPTGGFSCR